MVDPIKGCAEINLKIYLSKIYLPELLELVSVGELRETTDFLLICINFRVFSFAMAYNYKIVVALYECHITFCVQNLIPFII